MRSNKILETEINKNNKELCDALIKFEKIKEIHKDMLLKIKMYN